jgi:Rad3-related DNA helicase
MLITSGTLSPLEGTAESFGIPFPVVLENKHVINSSKQLWGGVLTAGPNNVRLDASYGKRDEPTYLEDLGRTVAAFASCVPDGVLLAFQSYAQKEAVLKAWRQTGIFDEIQKQKPVFEEPPSHFQMKEMMHRFNDAVLQMPTPSRPTGGAMLMAVCRGKLCEGIDFTDRQCRLVILIGVPYPARNDLRVMLKQNFLDTRGAEGDGRKWYVREAIRAVNQTVGRVIRHRHDFGAVLLCDDRYSREGRLAPFASGLPSWLRSEIFVRSSCNLAVETCRQFFRRHGRDVGSLPVAPAPTAEAQAQANSNQPQRAEEQQASQALTQRLKNLRGDSGEPSTDRASVEQPSRNQSQKAQQTTAMASLATSILRGTLAQTADRSSAAGAVPMSRLGSLWKQHRRTDQQEVAPKSAAVDMQSRASSGRAPASPHVTHTETALSSALSSEQQKPSRVRIEQRPSNPFLRQPSAKAPGRSGYMEGQAAERWLQAAERLLPKMEFDHVRASLVIVQEQSENIMADSIRAANTGKDMEVRLRSSMAAVVEALLPEFNFDSPDEKKVRENLVKDCAALMPKLVRSLWRKCVEDRLRATDQALWVWGR